MPQGLSSYARKFLTDADEVRKGQVLPVLVWEAPAKSAEQLLLGTSTGAPMDRPRAGEPLIYELKKNAAQKQNAFSMGITVGRTENNDIAIEDNSVSRFHAYFQQDARSQQWKLVDAESKNGTWVGPLKLAPNQSEVLTDGVKMRFGDVELTFYLPPTFFDYLKRLMG